MDRGSRKHVLDWTARPKFASELTALVPSIPVKITAAAKWMPRGFQDPVEARLESFGPDWIPSHPAWAKLEDWWLLHKRYANTPNWDIAVGCTIGNRPGLVLVEAKANWPELKVDGKVLDKNAPKNSQENHHQIGRAIDEARWLAEDPSAGRDYPRLSLSACQPASLHMETWNVRFPRCAGIPRVHGR